MWEVVVVARHCVFAVLGCRHDAEVELNSVATARRVLYFTPVLCLETNCRVQWKTALDSMSSLTVPFTYGFVDANWITWRHARGTMGVNGTEKLVDEVLPSPLRVVRVARLLAEDHARLVLV